MATSPLLVEFATRNAVFLEGVKADEVKKIQPFLREIDREIRLRLSQEALTSYSRQRLEQLLAQIDGILLGIYYRYLNELNADLVDIAEYEAAFEARSLDQVLINVTAAIPTLETVRAAINTEPLQVTGPDGGKLLQPFLRNWTEAEVARTTGAIRKGYVQGQTNQQIIQSIRGTKAANYEDGILATSYRNAEAIVRTAVQHVAMTGRMETLKNNDDVVIGYEWIATLDSRTTLLCQSLSGRVFKMGKGPMPPAHIRCRSSIAPSLDSRFDFLKEGATQASKDGPVSADLTYYAWLKRQPAAFQTQVLGVDRAKLFRNGGLSAERFAELQLDRNFKPLTLERMKALEPLAFDRAGI